MRVLKDHRGFSLVELIIVAGILAILASISLRLITHIRSANIEKATQYVSDALSKQQMKSMSKENKPNLFIYELNGTYYYLLTEGNVIDTSKGKVIGTGLTIKYNNGSDHTISGTGTDSLKITYKKDGSFKDCPNTLTITIGSASRTITFNRTTGRHVVSND